MSRALINGNLWQNLSNRYKIGEREFTDLDFTGETISELNLHGSTLRGKWDGHSSLIRCDLSKTKIIFDELCQSSFFQCDLSEAHFSGRIIDELYISFCMIKDVRFENCTIHQMYITSSEVGEISMRGCEIGFLSILNCTFTDKAQFDLTRAIYDPKRFNVPDCFRITY